MERAKDGEIAAVKCEDTGDIQALGQGHNCCIGEVKGRVLVLLHDLLHSRHVWFGERQYLKSGACTGKDLNRPRVVDPHHCHVEQFGQDRCGHNASFATQRVQSTAGDGMVGVPAKSKRQQHAGINQKGHILFCSSWPSSPGP